MIILSDCRRGNTLTNTQNKLTKGGRGAVSKSATQGHNHVQGADRRTPNGVLLYASAVLIIAALVVPTYSRKEWIVLTNSESIIALILRAASQGDLLLAIISVAIFMVLPAILILSLFKLRSKFLCDDDRVLLVVLVNRGKIALTILYSLALLIFGPAVADRYSLSAGVIVFGFAFAFLLFVNRMFAVCIPYRVELSSLAGLRAAFLRLGNTTTKILKVGAALLVVSYLAFFVYRLMEPTQQEQVTLSADRERRQTPETKEQCLAKAEALFEKGRREGGFREGDYTDQGILKRRECQARFR